MQSEAGIKNNRSMFRQIYRPLANEQLFYALKLTAFHLLRKKTATVVQERTPDPTQASCSDSRTPSRLSRTGGQTAALLRQLGDSVGFPGMTDKICPAWNMSTDAVSRSAVTDSPRLSVGPVTLTTHPAPRIRFIKISVAYARFWSSDFSCRRM